MTVPHCLDSYAPPLFAGQSRPRKSVYDRTINISGMNRISGIWTKRNRKSCENWRWKSNKTLGSEFVTTRHKGVNCDKWRLHRSSSKNHSDQDGAPQILSYNLLNPVTTSSILNVQTNLGSSIIKFKDSSCGYSAGKTSTVSWFWPTIPISDILTLSVMIHGWLWYPILQSPWNPMLQSHSTGNTFFLVAKSCTRQGNHTIGNLI